MEHYLEVKLRAKLSIERGSIPHIPSPPLNAGLSAGCGLSLSASFAEPEKTHHKVTKRSKT